MGLAQKCPCGGRPCQAGRQVCGRVYKNRENGDGSSAGAAEPMAPAGLGAMGAVAPAPEQNHNSDEQYARGQHASDDPAVTREPCDTGCVFAEVIGAEHPRRHPERASERVE